MAYKHITTFSIGEGITASLQELNKTQHIENRENQNKSDRTKEMSLVLDVTHPTSEPLINKCMPCTLKQLNQYIDEFIEGTADNAGWKYTYHKLYAPYYQELIEELHRNPQTRRACIALGQGNINFTNDPPCLQLLMCNTVWGEFELTAVFRSNDGVKAFPMNIQAIAALQRKIAKELDMQVGELHYIVNNFHAYSSDFKKLSGFCKAFDSRPRSQLYYSYEQFMQQK